MGLIQFLIFIASIVIAGGIILTAGLKRNQHGELIGLSIAPIVIAVLIFVGALFLNSSFGEIGAGERGVVKRFGAVTGQVLNPGLYAIMPVVYSVDRCNVQIQAYSTLAEAASSNQQDVHTTVTLNFHVRPESCITIVRDLNNDLQVRIIIPGVQEAVKAATAQYSALQLTTQRPSVRDQIEKLISERLTQFGAKADALSITQFTFSPEYTKAIEEKAVVQQQVDQAQLQLQQVNFVAQQKVKQAQADREAAILNAEGTARATELNGAAQAKVLQLQKEQVTPELVKLRQVEALNRWIEKWDGHVPNTVIGQGTGAIPFMNIPGAETPTK